MNTCKVKKTLYKLQNDEIELLGNRNDYVRGIRKGICLAIDAVENHNDWISANEPPKEDGEYIVVIKGGFAEATSLFYDHNTKSWYEDDSEGNRNYYNIIKWQPFPEV